MSILFGDTPRLSAAGQCRGRAAAGSNFADYRYAELPKPASLRARGAGAADAGKKVSGESVAARGSASEIFELLDVNAVKVPAGVMVNSSITFSSTTVNGRGEFSHLQDN